MADLKGFKIPDKSVVIKSAESGIMLATSMMGEMGFDKFEQILTVDEGDFDGP